MLEMGQCQLCGTVVPLRNFPSGMHDCTTFEADSMTLGPILTASPDNFECQVCNQVFPVDSAFKYDTCTQEHEDIVQAAIDKVGG